MKVWTNPKHHSLDDPRNEHLRRDHENRPQLIRRGAMSKLESVLIEAGIPIDALPQTMQTARDILAAEILRATSDAIREFVWMQPKDAQSVAKRRFAVGDSGESLRQCADKDGVSKSTLARHEAQWKQVGQPPTNSEGSDEAARND